MSEKGTVEERLTVLEREMADLKRQILLARAPGNWFGFVAGSFRDDPDFEEVLRLGRAVRGSDRSDARA